MRHCPQCNLEIANDQAKFCKRCGTALSPAPDHASETPETSQLSSDHGINLTLPGYQPNRNLPPIQSQNQDITNQPLPPTPPPYMEPQPTPIDSSKGSGKSFWVFLIVMLISLIIGIAGYFLIIQPQSSDSDIETTEFEEESSYSSTDNDSYSYDEEAVVEEAPAEYYVAPDSAVCY